MRAAMLCCLLVVGCRTGDKEQSSGSAAGGAERVVQRGLDAWNKHDVEGALSVYSPDAKLYHFPDKEVSHPLDSLRSRWQQRFAKEPEVRVTVSPRIVQGRFVIDHEAASGTANGKTRKVTWIYEVDGDRIVRAWLLPE